jgi:membrane protease YdiL (CAAX protease family)
LLERKYDEVPWTTQQTFTGILFTLVPWIILSLGFSVFNTSSTATSAVPLTPSVDLINAAITFVFSGLVEGAFVIAPFYFAIYHLRSIPHRFQKALEVLGFRRFDARQALAWMTVLFIGFVVVNIVYQFLITTFHLNLQPNDVRILTQGRSAPITTYATLLASVVFAPFCEEIFFRSFVFMGLLRSMSLRVAIVVSALIFAVAHGDPGSFVVLFAIGLALAFLRWRTRSIWPSIGLHFLNNFVGALQIFLAMQHVHL